jgi:hypothetical protein
MSERKETEGQSGVEWLRGERGREEGLGFSFVIRGLSFH